MTGRCRPKQNDLHCVDMARSSLEQFLLSMLITFQSCRTRLDADVAGFR